MWLWWIWRTILPFRSQSQTRHWGQLTLSTPPYIGLHFHMKCRYVVWASGTGHTTCLPGLGSFRRLKSSWHPTVMSVMWPYIISMGRVRSPKQSGRITLTHMVSMVAGQEVWAESPDKHVRCKFPVSWQRLWQMVECSLWKDLRRGQPPLPDWKTITVAVQSSSFYYIPVLICLDVKLD